MDGESSLVEVALELEAGIADELGVVGIYIGQGILEQAGGAQGREVNVKVGVGGGQQAGGLGGVAASKRQGSGCHQGGEDDDNNNDVAATHYTICNLVICNLQFRTIVGGRRTVSTSVSKKPRFLGV
jgi:hypothetical protein